jgi:phosphate/sulfate permease
MAANIVLAWVLTIPAAAMVAATYYFLLKVFVVNP